MVAEELEVDLAKGGIQEPVLVFRWSFIEKSELECLSSREFLSTTGDFIGA